MPRKRNGHALDPSSETDAETPYDPIDAQFGLTEREQAVEIAADTLTGDVRDFILDRLKHEQNKRPWHERSEAEQRETVHAVEAAVQRVVRQAIELLASNGRPTIKATVEQVVIKEGIKAVLTLPRSSEQRHALADATGFTVLLVVADPANFTGEREPVAITPDQADLVDAMVVHAQPDNALFS